jgi:dipeptidyl aminopeptidase/acylaminoacyl peptidase
MLREVAIGPTPSAGNAISATEAVALRAGELKRVTLEGDSSETVLVPKHQARYAGFFTVSRNQDRLAFRRTRDGDPDGDFSVLEVVNADGSGRTTIDVPFPMLNGPSALRFLPDGKQLVATALPTQDERNIAVYLITVETKAVKKLFTIPIFSFTNDLAVSPDGRTIVYVVNETTTPRVFTMDLSSLRANSRK